MRTITPLPHPASVVPPFCRGNARKSFSRFVRQGAMAPKRSRSNAAGSSNTPAAASPHEDEELPDAPGASPSDSSAAGSPAIDEVAAAAPAAPQPAAAADPLEEEDDGEELIGEDMETDYRPMGALDAYEEEGLDGNEYEPLDARSRAAVDAMLDARDGRERQSRLPAALLTPEEEDEEERPRRRRREAPQEQDAEVSALDGLGLDEDDVSVRRHASLPACLTACQTLPRQLCALAHRACVPRLLVLR